MTLARKARLGFLGAGWWATANYIPLLAKRDDFDSNISTASEKHTDHGNQGQENRYHGIIAYHRVRRRRPSHATASC